MMKSIKFSGSVFCVIIAALSLAAFIGHEKIPAKKVIAKTDEGKGFAVLELFTSEGCSSCPPADELLARIQKETQRKAVYVLVYHVDYWDRQGWKDAFSSAEFSNRQMQYSHWLSVSPVYTPQVVINGKAEFVGSNESAIRQAISGQLAASPNATLALQIHPDKEKLTMQYQVSNAVEGSRLLIVLLQKTAQSKVSRGENAGRTLSHVQIVREWQSEPLNPGGKGSSALVLPKDFNVQHWDVVGLVQDQRHGEILAAAKVDLDGRAQLK
jgi:hypothetical protein